MDSSVSGCMTVRNARFFLSFKSTSLAVIASSLAGSVDIVSPSRAMSSVIRFIDTMTL